jgi:hypothetical protein
MNMHQNYIEIRKGTPVVPDYQGAPDPASNSRIQPYNVASRVSLTYLFSFFKIFLGMLGKKLIKPNDIQSLLHWDCLPYYNLDNPVSAGPDCIGERIK